MTKRSKFPSELRFDVVSKDWVVIATGRARRPETFKMERKKGLPKEKCPFCKIETQLPPVLAYSHGKELPIPQNWPSSEISSKNKESGQNFKKFLRSWTTIIIPNLYPAFIKSDRLKKRKEGELYHTMDAVGFHEVVVTRDHEKQLAQFSLEQIKEVIDVYQKRYLTLMNERFVNYVSIFHNHGFEAGASIAHPHSQIVTTPLIDPDLRGALLNSQGYFKKHKKCVYCEMAAWERKTKKRVVFENRDFLAICPFASKAAFEIIISPKKHLSYFERITEKEKQALTEAFKEALGRLYKALNDPPYNFYLHTAPCDGKNYDFYHWHWTILPKTAILAGFELGAGMEISTIEPERAAEFLGKQKLTNLH